MSEDTLLTGGDAASTRETSVPAKPGENSTVKKKKERKLNS